MTENRVDRTPRQPQPLWLAVKTPVFWVVLILVYVVIHFTTR